MGSVTEPAGSPADDEPEHVQALLTGSLPDGKRVLVTVWRTRGEIAFRETDTGTWGPPTYLNRMEVQ